MSLLDLHKHSLVALVCITLLYRYKLLLFIVNIYGAGRSTSLTVFVFVHRVANIVQRYDPLLTGEATAEVDQLTVVTQTSATASSFMVGPT